jgi:hypothetical protein
MAVRINLEPLGRHEAADYLVQHLRAAGGRPDKILTDEAMEVLAAATRGLPRLLNQATHSALTLAQSAEASIVDAEVAMEALAILGLEAAPAGDGSVNLSPLGNGQHSALNKEETPAEPVLPLVDQEIAGPVHLAGEEEPPYRRFSPPRRPA